LPFSPPEWIDGPLNNSPEPKSKKEQASKNTGDVGAQDLTMESLASEVNQKDLIHTLAPTKTLTLSQFFGWFHDTIAHELPKLNISLILSHYT
jgi:hypothetical protein